MTKHNEWIHYLKTLQNTICNELEIIDGSTKFNEHNWIRPEGGGGLSRIISNGSVFEKGGVNFSSVYGEVNETMRSQLKINNANATKWFASGLSLVLHPMNPFIPTVHCNYRMFELYDSNENIIDQWFGGGTDLTPYYLIEEDAKHFHLTYKNVCDEYDSGFYSTFKEFCDNYFVNTHRNNERRGIGGIFYDYKRPDLNKNVDFWMNFGKACSDAFIKSYIPIVEKRKNTPYTSENKHWQEIRRGRYVEFNLIHDRGTLFGLKSNGRIESILMSLPPTVRFEYDYKPLTGTEEDKLLQVCLHPQSWV